MPTAPGRELSASWKTFPLARDTYRIRFECPDIARRIVPGQFLMMRLAGGNDPLLGRPLALYDVASLDGRASRRRWTSSTRPWAR